MLVQVGDDLLVAHRPLADADPLHAEDLLNDERFGRLGHQPLLGLGPAHLGDFGRIAERRDGTVPEARFGIAAHGVARELTGLAGLVLVELGQDRADKIALGVLADFLRDRDELDAGPLELAAVMFEQVLVAEQAAEGVDADLGDAAAGADGLGQHRLEPGTIIVGAGKATVAVDRDQLDPALGIVGAQPLFLIVEADPAIGLPLG